MFDHLSLCLLATSVLIPAVLGLPQNVTCDDQYGCGLPTGGAEINFISLDNGWSQGSTCSRCALRPDPTLVFNGTWHDSTLDLGQADQMTIDITFHGTAIYTFFILPDDTPPGRPNVCILANMSVFLDSELVATILHEPTGQTDFIYDYLGYANTILSNDTHLLSISANNQNASSNILFDYFIYTTDTSALDSKALSSTLLIPSPTPSVARPTYSTLPSKTAKLSTPSTGVLVGGILGALLICAIVSSFVLWRRRRHPLAKELSAETSRASSDCMRLQGARSNACSKSVANMPIRIARLQELTGAALDKSLERGLLSWREVDEKEECV